MGINPLNCPVNVVIAVVAVGRLPGRGGARARCARDDVVLAPHRPEHAAGDGQGQRPESFNSQLAKMEAMHSGYDEAILLNEQGYLADGSGENVFMVQDGVLTTPPGDRVLPARHHARHGDQDCPRHGLRRCARSTSCAATSTTPTRSSLRGTAAEITPIRSIDEHEIGAGPITKRIQTEFFAITKGRWEGITEFLLDYPAKTAAKASRQQGGAPDTALAARHRAAGGGVRPGCAALRHPRARPVRAQLREGVRGLLPLEHAVTVSSGTAGLHLLVRAAGIGAGDEVITAPISFVASANVMLYERATPVFADVDPETFVLDPEAVEAAVHAAHAGDPARARVRLPVRHGGARCDRREALARDHREPPRPWAASTAASASAVPARPRCSLSTPTSR